MGLGSAGGDASTSDFAIQENIGWELLCLEAATQLVLLAGLFTALCIKWCLLCWDVQWWASMPEIREMSAWSFFCSCNSRARSKARAVPFSRDTPLTSSSV